MRKRAASASAAAKSVAKGKSTGHDAFFTSPDPSSKPYHFDLPSFPTATAASSSLNTTPASYLRHPPSPPPSAKDKTTTLATISDLKALASSRIDSLKRHLDLCRSDILRDFDASNTRLSKRFKIQTKACLQLTEEAEKDYKKIADRISEHTETIKASYAEVISEAHSTASRVCKVSIPELIQSMEKAIEGLRSRYKIPATPI
ncbi:uncharacterized protein LOC103986749 [Musa acuminata AAA Group]|uniref:uncharacterized protein LOC103986749 n=1 Tax=Musa acuminata AAA Group TaxID=214697 RepID=UPI0031D325C4